MIWASQTSFSEFSGLAVPHANLAASACLSIFSRASRSLCTSVFVSTILAEASVMESRPSRSLSRASSSLVSSHSVFTTS